MRKYLGLLLAMALLSPLALADPPGGSYLSIGSWGSLESDGQEGSEPGKYNGAHVVSFAFKVGWMAYLSIDGRTWRWEEPVGQPSGPYKKWLWTHGDKFFRFEPIPGGLGGQKYEWWCYDENDAVVDHGTVTIYGP